VINLHHNKTEFKHKEKRHRTFNAEIKKDSNAFLLESDENEKVSKKIVTLFKKAVNKMIKSK